MVKSYRSLKFKNKSYSIYFNSLPTLKDCEEKFTKSKITESTESQVKGLFKHTILPAFSEDFTFSDKKEADKALKTLKKLVSQLKVTDFFLFGAKATKSPLFKVNSCFPG